MASVVELNATGYGVLPPEMMLNGWHVGWEPGSCSLGWFSGGTAQLSLVVKA